jgi:hypothetical protein
VGNKDLPSDYSFSRLSGDGKCSSVVAPGQGSVHT